MRLCLLLFALLFEFTAAYRYLMISVNIGYSHLAFNGQLADILVKAGHEVVSFFCEIWSFEVLCSYCIGEFCISGQF
jgi:hypothetical protein